MRRSWSRRAFLGLGAAAGAVGLTGLYSVFLERRLVLIEHYTVPLSRLPRAFDGYRIVQLTDLHHGKLVSLDFLAGVLQRAMQLQPDLIVCSGDYVHQSNHQSEIDGIWPLLCRLSAPDGVWSVLGNHDHWADTERSLDWLRNSGQDLRHRTHCLERSGQRLWLAGTGDYWEDHQPLDTTLDAIPPADCRLVVAHNPDTADTAFSASVDLMLAGHTHGGQVHIPGYGPPVLPVNNRDYSAGLLVSRKGFPLFISRGIGWAIYPVRFNCYPEIAVLQLRCA